MPDPSPRLGRPRMPASYGLSQDLPPGDEARWRRAVQQLTTARNYWISTAGPGGRPHAVPVWGLFLDGRLIFSTARRSRKGLNLAANPRAVAHLESGDDVVILDGSVEEVIDDETLARYADLYDAKYHFRPDPKDPENYTFALRPSVAYTWSEQDFPESAACWTFSPVG
jgi:pyridoxamine 5'-phosphate oxidase-like protein